MISLMMPLMMQPNLDESGIAREQADSVKFSSESRVNQPPARPASHSSFDLPPNSTGTL